jgi:serine/threonine protein kinase
MDQTASSEEYSGESVQTYGQTEPQSQHEELLNRNSTEEPPKAAWKYHNLDSGLLEFLCFLAEHEVVVIKNEELSKDDKHKSESGSSMQVFRGHWKGRRVMLKYPVDDKMPLDNSAGDSQEYDRRLKMYRNLQKDLMFEIQIMAHSHLNQHRNIVKLLAVAFENFLITFKRSDSKGKDIIEEIFLPILVVEPAMATCPTLKHYFEVHSDETIPIDLAVDFICDIAAGLAAVHLYGITHGDVKDTNVLLFQETVDGRDKIVAKIADFGASGIETSREDIRGLSFDWAAPEMLNRPSGWLGLRRTPAADIYSFGLLAATIALNGKKVFAEDVEGYDLKMKDEAHIHIKQRLEGHLRGSNCTSYQDRKEYIKALKAIIESTVRFNPSERWSDLSVVPSMLGKEYVKLYHIGVHDY